MKKIVTLTMAALLLLGIFTFNVSAQENVSVYIDGTKIEFDVQPQIINGRTMVPMRKIFEELGAVVGWFGDNQEIWANRGNITTWMNIGKNSMYVNTAEIVLDVSPCIIDGRTLVPVRAISESYGADVSWDGNTSTVSISTKNSPIRCFKCNGYGYYGNTSTCESFLNTLFTKYKQLKTEIATASISSKEMRETYNKYREAGYSCKNHMVNCSNKIIKCIDCNGTGILNSVDVSSSDANPTTQSKKFNKISAYLKNNGFYMDEHYGIKGGNILLSYAEKENIISLYQIEDGQYEVILIISENGDVTYRYIDIKASVQMEGIFNSATLTDERQNLPYFSYNGSSQIESLINEQATLAVKMAVMTTDIVLYSNNSDCSTSDLGFVALSNLSTNDNKNPEQKPDNSKRIQEIEELIDEANDAIKDIKADIKSFKKEISNIEADIDDLEETLNNASQEKTVRVLTENGWVWEADSRLTRPIEDAIEELEIDLEFYEDLLDEAESTLEELEDLKDELEDELETLK